MTRDWFLPPLCPSSRVVVVVVVLLKYAFAFRHVPTSVQTSPVLLVVPDEKIPRNRIQNDARVVQRKRFVHIIIIIARKAVVVVVAAFESKLPREQRHCRRFFAAPRWWWWLKGVNIFIIIILIIVAFIYDSMCSLLFSIVSPGLFGNAVGSILLYHHHHPAAYDWKKYI